MELIIFLAIGALAGFAAGLFGVGGGTIIVPLLFIVFTQMGFNPDVIMHLALGTSLATIIVTSISSFMAHHKNGAVIWPVFQNFAPPMAIGCFIGAGIAGWLSGIHLQIIVGVFLIWVAYTMFKGAKQIIDSNKELPSARQQRLAGAGIGLASAIFGIGGGSITVPYLNRYGVVMQKAVGTSAACGLPIAIAGALGFMFFGMKAQVNIPNTIGFVHIYAFLGISIMSFMTAKLGAKAAHALSPAVLKKCFSALLLLVGCFFILKGMR
ncbi:sulfite exporter TauE/SafE family protein [Acinetobacter sp. 194]|uniref:sulfite exporter TauE/SafE family protein n=1 Tax=Acinetobacter shaoyimingii TaxID=2715164 RepID=UPI00140D9CAF|nr:sulfite exporter TauE/SafE family protein [Acinetobacter shaoyimingii]NHB57841.1 sulfite exporter TauE/SafE family protein [Acinetobacter shaoyimingii]